ncbi:MAG: M1 family metallopeptidase [Saprospiraceae bacterium]|nr:M1 family metallopeptidase [Saprospiraceae bacterium]MBK7811052.1 M1 family metallopeptidase [Saprospiraceae bacterium]MBK9630656.1 M1 family metallopeptidase [Saprospiraceae bacterium]
MKIKHLATLFFIVLLSTGLFSQSNSAYFQQALDYRIQVSLDDQLHLLNGQITIRYTNNSPDVLDKIGMHLWPNAYSAKNTAFAKQKLLHRATKFEEAKPEQMGGISALNFTVDQQSAKLEFVKNNPDMAWLILPQALKPGQSIEIKTPFKVKIPNSFSRLGQANQTYQITQWYPKPAVYDHKGWHLMPYLDQGEFYSEFGNFSVEINLPSEYVVGATGVLQNLEEKSFLMKRAADTKSALEKATPITFVDQNNTQRKTISYTAEQVHDFAWFADKNFYVQLDTLQFSNGRIIECWSYFNNPEIWRNSASFVKRAVKFYSDYVGEYPYPQASAVESALSAGAGMEYPMITVIGQAGSESALDEVITHEVGHNWFYGILASNERDHPFMDESINTYYEARYMDLYYPVQMKFSGLPFSRWLGNIDIEQFGYLVLSRKYLDQHPDQASENFMGINYGLDVYSRAPKLIAQAEKYLGTAEFDKIMQAYYQKWKFKHPYTEDLYAMFKEMSPKNLDWLFEKLIKKDDKIDYGFLGIQKKKGIVNLNIKNHTGVNSPLYLSGIKDGVIMMDTMLDGFEGKKKISLKDESYDLYRIDGREETYELFRHNNSIRTKGMFKRLEPLSLKLVAPFDNPDKIEIGLTPVLGYNLYDGLMAGVYITQPWLPPRRWRLSIMPMYAFRSKEWVGWTQMYVNRFFTESAITQLQLGWNAKKYSFDKSVINDVALQYLQLSPHIEIRFKTNLAKMLESKLRYSFHWIQDDEYAPGIDSPFIKETYRNSFTHELKYSYFDPHILRPKSFEILAQFQKYDIQGRDAQYLRIDAEYNQKWMYKKSRYFEMRLASSFFPINSERKSLSYASREENILVRGSAGASFQAYHDYTNQDLFLGRSEYEGKWSQQIMIRQGGMKIAHGIAQRNNLGNTNSFLAAINLSSDIPVKKIGKYIRPYFDLCYVHSYDPSDPAWLASGGINLRFMDRVLNIYLPIWNSQAISELYRHANKPNYWKQITFSFRFKLNGLSELSQFVTLN